MKAMILAAGLGSRLRPLTNDRPKALVEIGGRTLLEIAIARLRQFGVNEIIINVHHFADQIDEYLHSKNNFGMRIEISREPVLLDTGGGLKHAAWFFLEDSSDRDQPFFLHNVDIISTIDLQRMLEVHKHSGALATLAVQDRPTSRYLLFDDGNRLCGRRSGLAGPAEVVRPVATSRPLAFSGIHVISPRLLSRITEEGAFSIIYSYLRLARDEEVIVAFPADAYRWRDVGRLEDLSKADAELY